jgi:hypothetical protein
MRRRIAIVLLAAGSIAGYTSGFVSMHHRMQSRRAHFEQHVARICTDAARQEGRGAPAPAAAPTDDED